MRIVILDGHAENPGDLSWAGFSALGELSVYERTQPDEILSRIGDAQIVYTNKTPLSRATIEGAPNLRFIGVLATGYNIVDVEAAKERGIPVANVPTYGTEAVAQYVFALLLEVCHHVGHHNQAVQAGRWTGSADFSFWDYPLIELSSKTMGIVGFGRIGQAVGRIASAFGMRVLIHDQKAAPAQSVPLTTLLERSDVVSLHCPLLPDTKNMINESTLSRMKPSAILINTARGPLVDEGALRDALRSGRLYAAAVDVVSSEPIAPDNPLLGLDNCLITPHIAWAPKESRQRLMDISLENLRMFLQGKPQNIVNP